uniref:BPTI/Kunitz inhibitor domain-containing protein n=1 Tax=Amblyomma cajennense TaxID=34607 RepID=A0A023FQC3_AMBCJ
MNFVSAECLLLAASCFCVAQYASGCHGPPQTGPCKASIPMWFFDPKTNTCHTFIYGGCGGNNNKFSSKENCLRTCSKKHWLSPVCKKKPDSGACLAYIPHWYFNHEKGYCQGFVYGGCKGNGNRFTSCWKCMESCGKRRDRHFCKKLIPEFNRSFYGANAPYSIPRLPK